MMKIASRPSGVAKAITMLAAVVALILTTGAARASADATANGFTQGYDQLFNNTNTANNPFAQYYNVREQQYDVDGPMNVDVTQPMCVGGSWGAFVNLGVNTDSCITPQVSVFNTTPDYSILYLDESVRQWNGTQYVALPVSQQVELGRGWAWCPIAGAGGSDCSGYFTQFHSPTNSVWGWRDTGPAWSGLDGRSYQTTTTLWFYQGGKWHYMSWVFVVQGARWSRTGYTRT
jgi:hypothetical protein